MPATARNTRIGPNRAGRSAPTRLPPEPPAAAPAMADCDEVGEGVDEPVKVGVPSIAGVGSNTGVGSGVGGVGTDVWVGTGVAAPVTEKGAQARWLRRTP